MPGIWGPKLATASCHSCQVGSTTATAVCNRAIYSTSQRMSYTSHWMPGGSLDEDPKEKKSQKSEGLLLKVKLVGNCPYSWSHNSFPSFQHPRPLVYYRGRRPRQPVNQTAAGHVRRKVVANRGSLVFAHGGKPANSETAQEDTAENREKVANIHCHDSQHAIRPLVPRFNSSAGNDCSQQISNTSDGRIDQCPDGINRKSPWSPNTVLLLNDGDIFLDAILGEYHFLRHAVR